MNLAGACRFKPCLLSRLLGPVYTQQQTFRASSPTAAVDPDCV